MDIWIIAFIYSFASSELFALRDRSKNESSEVMEQHSTSRGRSSRNELRQSDEICRR